MVITPNEAYTETARQCTPKLTVCTWSYQNIASVNIVFIHPWLSSKSSGATLSLPWTTSEIIAVSSTCVLQAARSKFLGVYWTCSITHDLKDNFATFVNNWRREIPETCQTDQQSYLVTLTARFWEACRFLHCGESLKNKALPLECLQMCYLSSTKTFFGSVYDMVEIF